MAIFRVELGQLRLLLLLILFFLFCLISQGVAGGVGLASKSQNCIGASSVQKGKCLISVIVELDLSLNPHVDKAGDPQVKKKQEPIQAAQDTVLKFMEDQNTAYVRRYKLLPYIAISTDGNGIMKLLSAPQVKAISPDHESSTQGKLIKTQ